jgi:exopolysaccharide biosynthesis polyprenyl glycosylphosphotransferase
MLSRHPTFKYIFLSIDIFVMTISFAWALTLYIPDFWSISTHPFFYYYSFLFLYFSILLIFLFSFRFNDLYKRNVVISSRNRQFFKVLKAVVVGSILSIIFMIITNVSFFSIYGKGIIFNFIAYSLILLLLFRVLLSKGIFYYLSKRRITKRRILIIGGDDAGRHAAKSLMQDPFQDFEIVGFLDDYKPVNSKIYDQFLNTGKLRDIENITQSLNADEILIAIDHFPYERMIFIVDRCLQTNKPVRIYSDLLKVISNKLNVELYSNIPLVEFSQYSLNDPVWTLKRILDVLISLTAIILFLPLFVFIAIGIKLSSKGPVIYKQVRVGKDGKLFNFYKFRSMHMDSGDEKHKEFVKEFIKAGKEGIDQDIYKITDDGRIFELGKFIRKLSIDEFPQLFNVLKGEMGLVGPRPCLPYEWEEYDEWHKNRIKILPGCTGLWQALGRSSVTFEEMVILDLYYISNMTLWLDFMIILKTVPAMLSGEGAY